jgi:hypothetical protein
MPRHRRQLVAAPLLCISLVACPATPASDGEGDEDSESSEATDGTGDETGDEEFIDVDAVVERASDYATWEKINAEPRASEHGLAQTVNMWVEAEYADLYRGIDPELASSDTVFPEGAILLKEHLDAEGTPVGFTMMVKAAPGYDPGFADWWWARANLDGSLEENGQVGFCQSCHEPRAGTDFVWGVPLDNRN